MNQMTRSARVLSRTLAIVSLLLCICAIPAFAQDWRVVRDGVEYAEVTKEISGLKVNMNLLRLNLSKVRIDVVHALDAAIGTEKTSSIAARHGALAAINAGFFRLDTSAFAGDAAGILQIDGKLLSEPNGERIQLLINNQPRETDVFIARLALTESVKLGKVDLEVTGINRERKKDDLVMYTPEFGATTLTGNDGVEVAVSRYRVAIIKNDLGNSVIPKDGFVLSATGIYRDRLLAAAAKNEKVTYIRHADGVPPELKDDPMTFPSQWDIVAGVPQLIRDGKIEITWEQEKTTKPFVETRHPRTAVAKLRDGKFLMITVDGRTESSGGIGLQDLAEYLLSLGAVDAMNLDGGGSTTMFVDGKVVNHPSDKDGERKVSDALLVTMRRTK
ncbi:MAG: phosphodiester glycosidase family protein [Acidobacteriota bacterium]